MNNLQIWFILRKNAGLILLSGLLLAALAFAGMIVLEKSFKAQTDFIVIQNQKSNLDYYALSKSAEYLGKVLSESVYSETFIEEAIKSGKIEEEFLPLDKKNRLEEWNRIVRVNRKSDLGIIELMVFADDQKNALKISQGVAFVLAEKSALFLGENSGATIRILSGPIVEKNPSAKNLLAAILGGLVLGTLLSSMVVILKKRPTELFFTDEDADGLFPTDMGSIEDFETLDRQ